MNYSDLIQALTIDASQAAASFTPPYSLVNNPDFSNMLPRFIEYAEDRIYREMTFLANRTQNTSQTFTGITRAISLSAIAPPILVVEGVAVITPVTDTPANGTRNQFAPASLDVIDTVWPTESMTVDPSTTDSRYWAMKDAETIVVCPTPDAAYIAEITGLFMPAPISQTNDTTYLSATYPDLLLAAAMISVTGYLRDFGQQSDNPQIAQSWETQYKTLASSVSAEEQRRRGQGVGWSANNPTPLATPPRT